MHERRKKRAAPIPAAIVLSACAFVFSLAAFAGGGQGVTPAATPASDAGVAVGAQYDSTHVYVAHGDFDAFVASFIATFGGTAAKRSVTNVLPVPSSEEFQPVTSPVGMLSIFAFQTPIPFPFGAERTGYLVT